MVQDGVTLADVFSKNQRFQLSPIISLEYLIILKDLWEKSVTNVRSTLVIYSFVQHLLAKYQIDFMLVQGIRGTD